LNPQFSNRRGDECRRGFETKKINSPTLFKFDLRFWFLRSRRGQRMVDQRRGKRDRDCWRRRSNSGGRRCAGHDDDDGGGGGDDDDDRDDHQMRCRRENGVPPTVDATAAAAVASRPPVDDASGTERTACRRRPAGQKIET